VVAALVPREVDMVTYEEVARRTDLLDALREAKGREVAAAIALRGAAYNSAEYHGAERDLRLAIQEWMLAERAVLDVLLERT